MSMNPEFDKLLFELSLDLERVLKSAHQISDDKVDIEGLLKKCTDFVKFFFEAFDSSENQREIECQVDIALRMLLVANRLLWCSILKASERHPELFIDNDLTLMDVQGNIENARQIIVKAHPMREEDAYAW